MTNRAFGMFVLSVVIAVAGAGTGTGWANTPDDLGELFREGNSLYENGQYAEAVDRYRAIVDAGVVDADLYYDLANAHYKNDELGSAVLYYEKTLRLVPRNRDAKENLALVRSQLRDKQFVRKENPALRVLMWPHKNLSTGEMVVMASAAYVLLCVLLVAFISRYTPAVARVYRRVSVISPGRFLGLSYVQDLVLALGIALFLSASTALSASRKIGQEVRQREAVVLEAEIGVFSSPTRDATLQFKIHEGTVVEIREERSRWVKIRLPGGLSGWLLDARIEKV